MSRDSHLGEFEHLLLLSLMQNGGTSYGAVMRQTLSERIHRDVSIGALYATLERLEKKGFLTTSTGKPTAERGGRAKRYYHISAQGKRALQQTKSNLETMWKGIQLWSQ